MDMKKIIYFLQIFNIITYSVLTGIFLMKEKSIFNFIVLFICSIIVGVYTILVLKRYGDVKK